MREAFTFSVRTTEAIIGTLLSLRLALSAGWALPFSTSGFDVLVQVTASRDESGRELGGEACKKRLRGFRARNRMIPSQRAAALRRCSAGSSVEGGDASVVPRRSSADASRTSHDSQVSQQKAPDLAD